MSHSSAAHPTLMSIIEHQPSSAPDPSLSRKSERRLLAGSVLPRRHKSSPIAQECNPFLPDVLRSFPMIQQVHPGLKGQIMSGFKSNKFKFPVLSGPI